MRDLESKRLIVVKGGLFLVVAAVTFGLIFMERPSVRMAILLALLVWAACRFYYFLFYVLEKYVDPSLRYAGLIALVGAVLHRKTGDR